MQPSATALIVVLLAGGQALPAQQPAAKLDAGIAAGDRQLPVFVRMVDQVVRSGPDFDAYCRKNAGIKRRAHRTEFLATLKAKSAKSWQALAKTVSDLGNAVQDVERYWVVNGFACLATGDACLALARHDAVAFIYRKPAGVPGLHKNTRRQVGRRNQQALTRRTQQWAKRALAELETAAKGSFPAIDKLTPTWNLERIGAVAAWKSGAFGQGVTTALLDSGLLPTPALSRALWRNPREELNGKDDDGNGYVDDLFGYDFSLDTGISIGEFRFPPHGTICGGIIAGRPVDINGKLTVTGVAPQSRLMVIRGMGLIKSYEYALDNGADIVSMSYMWVRVPLGNWRGLYRLAHEHMTLAGIVSVGGSGNFGTSAPKGKQIALPKDIPCVIAASGLDQNDVMPAFSSRGPCSWDGVRFYDDYPPAQPLAKPDITAYTTGYPMWAMLPQNRQLPWKVVHRTADGAALVIGPRGNSFSGPHAAGVAALMLSANPDLPAWRVKEMMEASCRDLGEKGRDHQYGSGMVDAAKAVAAARAAR